MKKILSLALLVLVIMLFASCSLIETTDADVASYNLSKDADMFRINRRVVFYNGITDAYILSIEGRSSVEFFPDKFVVTVKTGPNEYKKHYLGRADNVFPFVEQLDAVPVDVYHYKVIFKPSVIIPDIEIK
jgi:hypothetical protein